MILSEYSQEYITSIFNASSSSHHYSKCTYKGTVIIPHVEGISDKFKLVSPGRAEFLAANPEVRVRFPALPDFLSSNGSGTGSTQPL
jgi:hypothetical protein